MKYERLSSELIRALRGARSQTALSRRLGYRSNVVYTWEAGDGFPTAARALALARRVGVEPTEALTRFYDQPPGWLADADVATRSGVARLLGDLRGHRSINELATASGRNRYAVSRWIKGATEPRLPDFLRLIDACSLRLLDFLAAFVDPAELPEAAEAWRALEAARGAARDAPWSHAVLRALELDAYRALPGHERGWIAQRLGIGVDQEDQCLELLLQAGQIRKGAEGHFEHQVATVDVRRDRLATRNLAAWCAELAHTRLVESGAGTFAFNLFGVSAQDLTRLRQLQRDYFAELRAIVAESQPVERVAVANLQLFCLDE